MQTGEAIGRLAAALSGALSPVDVAVALAEQGAAAAGAQFSNMAVHDGGRTWVIHGEGLAPDTAERWAELGDVETPLTDAIEGGAPILLPSLDVIGSRYPVLADDTEAAGLQATASWPLLAADGTAVGAAGFGWAEPQPFGEEQQHLLELIATMTASALERAQLYRQREQASRQREVADAQLLQDIFLPRRLPVVDRLEIAARYLPASDAPMGGDWYDVFDVDGVTCFVIGDVAGHGLQAAATMAQLRNAARAYAVEHAAPAHVMTELNRLLCRLEPTATATSIVATWDPQLEVIMRTNAGHPPILRCRPGEVEYLQPAKLGPLLGADAAASYGEELKQLRPGTTLLLYTDGLIEQRGESLADGMQALRDFVAALDDLTPQAVCDAVLEWRLDYGRREDDICMMAVRLS